MSSGILLCVIAAVGFGAWPLIARTSGAHASWVTIVVTIITMVVAVIGATNKVPGAPTNKAITILVLAGITNGIGMIAYGRLLTDFEMSALAPAALTMMIVIIAVGGIIFFHEAITWQKMVGVACGAVAAWLLTR